MDEDVQDNDNPKIKPYNICLAAEVVEYCSQRARDITHHVTHFRSHVCESHQGKAKVVSVRP